MAVQVTVKGFDKLQRNINRVAKLLGDDVAPALLAGAEVIKDGIRAKITEQDLIDSGALYNSVNARIVGPREAQVREGPLAYVFAQEFGLPNQRITPRQRRYFWARYIETEDSMWRALALSTTYTIPAKPHFRPGVTQSRRGASIAIAKTTTRLLISNIGG